MNNDFDDIILKEIKSRTVFELIYEFIIWDYTESKNELDLIKKEILLRSQGSSLRSFILNAWLINFSTLVSEIFIDRWELFETNKRKIIFQIIAGLAFMSGLVTLLLYFILMNDSIIWKYIFSILLLSHFCPSAIKTYKDYINFNK